MGIYFEAGVGKATAGSSLEMGRSAAMEAISQPKKFTPRKQILKTETRS
jgi:hypothetical protein